LQQFQPFQFVNPNEVATDHGFDVIHFNFIVDAFSKPIVINQVKDSIFIGIFQQ